MFKKANKFIRGWKYIKDYEGLYEVSTDGKIRSVKNGKYKELKKYKDKYGYENIGLTKNKTQKLYKAHRLVAGAFIPNPENKPHVDHINTIRDDNRVSNLRWVTIKENNNNVLTKEHISNSKKGILKTSETKMKMSKSKTGIERDMETKMKISKSLKGNKSPNARPVYCYEFNYIKLSAVEWEEELNLPKNTVSSCCRGVKKHSGGYHFRWATKKEIEEFKKETTNN